MVATRMEDGAQWRSRGTGDRRASPVAQEKLLLKGFYHAFKCSIQLKITEHKLWWRRRRSTVNQVGLLHDDF